MEEKKEYCTCCRNNCPIGDLQCRKGKEKWEKRQRELKKPEPEETGSNTEK